MWWPTSRPLPRAHAVAKPVQSNSDYKSEKDPTLRQSRNNGDGDQFIRELLLKKFRRDQDPLGFTTGLLKASFTLVLMFTSLTSAVRIPNRQNAF